MMEVLDVTLIVQLIRLQNGSAHLLSLLNLLFVPNVEMGLLIHQKKIVIKMAPQLEVAIQTVNLTLDGGRALVLINSNHYVKTVLKLQEENVTRQILKEISAAMTPVPIFWSQWITKEEMVVRMNVV